ncbi:hypothetical protein TWF481_006655 [Arthrobotrys musiformis]|uniref:Uncharacterized protein n=1 Tax=Arthrobotrys musiformis TaxID=47236 RepID=A0AAV9WB41_9PEZI
MLDDITHPLSLPQLPALTLLPKLHDPFLSHNTPSSASFERPQVDALVKRCEASLRRLSTLTHSFQPLGNMSTVTLVPNLTDNGFDDIKKPSAIVTVTELLDESRDQSRNTQSSLRKTKAQLDTTRSKKWKVSKPTRPVPSRANSGLSRKSGSAMGHVSDENRSRCSCDTAPTRSRATTATSFCDVAMGDPISPKRAIGQFNDGLIPSAQPDDSNICSLLNTAVTTSNEALLHSCINHLRNTATTSPLITIKASAPFAGERPNVPSIVAAQIRPILHEAVRTLLDDYPDYDCGEPSQRWNDYLNSVPAQLQQLFSAEWCRYVRRIKSFHENSPWDDFDYDHTQSCPHKDGCEMYTRVQVREAWNRFWKESILSGNRCVPKPSQVAQFLCNYGNDITPLQHGNQPNVNCVAGFREELAQTLECLGGDNARYNWKWLGDSLFKQRK